MSPVDSESYQSSPKNLQTSPTFGWLLLPLSTYHPISTGWRAKLFNANLFHSRPNSTKSYCSCRTIITYWYCLLFFRVILAWENLASTSYCSHLIVCSTEHMGQLTACYQETLQDIYIYTKRSLRLGGPQQSLIALNYSNLLLYTHSFIYLHIVPLYNHYCTPIFS